MVYTIEDTDKNSRFKIKIMALAFSKKALSLKQFLFVKLPLKYRLSNNFLLNNWHY